MYPFAFVLKARWIWCVLLTAGMGRFQELPAPATASPPSDQQQAAAVGSSRTTPSVGQAKGEGALFRVHRVCRVTAYCDRGTTASGIPSGVGQCAAPADIPFGSTIYIPALDRTFVVTDRTARRFRHNTVDIFIPTRKQCRKFGRQYLKCEFAIPADPPPYGSPGLARAVEQMRS
jgi:rare lipoprotein A